MIATDESPVKKIAQLIWIPGESACWRIAWFSTSSSFLLNQEPIFFVDDEELSSRRCWYWKRWDANDGIGKMVMLLYGRV